MLNKIAYLRDPHPSEPIIFNSDNLYTKRILLTTTSLVLAAGVAQADVSFSGTAGVALIDDNGASDATRVVIWNHLESSGVIWSHLESSGII